MKCAISELYLTHKKCDEIVEGKVVLHYLCRKISIGINMMTLGYDNIMCIEVLLCDML